MDRVTVYITLRNEERVCEYGDNHIVKLYTRKFLYPTLNTYLLNNGYEKSVQPIYRDGQGRDWRKVVTIDYSNNVYYTTRDAVDRTIIGYPRPPYNGIDLTANL